MRKIRLLFRRAFRSPQRLWILLDLLLILFYGSYLAFIIIKDQGPIDYETFMRIGSRLVHGQEVYGENSYYPMPYVMVFAGLSLLPRPVSMTIWFLAPILLGLWIMKGSPAFLLFAPTLSHFTGGQSAFFGLAGLWGYRKYQQAHQKTGGVFLGLSLIKPQLGVLPLIWAVGQWWQFWKREKKLPSQMIAFLVTTALIYLPGFFLIPDWPLRWLQSPRPVSERALSAIVPRTLLYLAPSRSISFWVLLIVIALCLLWAVWRINQRTLNLDLFILWGFVVFPMVHDYDLLQLAALLEGGVLQWAAVLLSIPGWLVVLFAYTNDAAWFMFTLLAPGLLTARLYLNRKERRNQEINDRLQSIGGG